MDAQISALQQILEHLFVDDNNTRNMAETALNAQMEANASGVLLALSHMGTSQTFNPELRSLTLLLLRTLSLKAPAASPTNPSPSKPLIQSIGPEPRAQVYETLLASLPLEPETSTRNRLSDTIAGLARVSLEKDHEPWATLGATLGGLIRNENPAVRESVLKIWEDAPGLIEKEDPAAVRGVFQNALNDPQSLEVRLAALRGTSSFLQNTSNSVREASGDLMLAVFNLLHSLPEDQQTDAIQTLIPIASMYPSLFTPHLPVLVPFLLQLSHPPQPTADEPALEIPSDHPAQPAFELLLSLVEVKPAVFRRVPNFANDAARVAIQCLARLGDDAEWGTQLDDEDDDADEGEGSWSVWGEECMDRLAEGLGGKTFLPGTWDLVEGLCKGAEWKGRYAGLMSIASIAEGTAKVMQPQLSKIMELICPMVEDPHPRVRFALVHCLGQLCTDFEGYLQALHPVDILRILLSTFHHPLPKVYSHAAAALINFCDGIDDPEVISPYLDDIVKGLLGLLETGSKGVQEQAVTTLATVANAAEMGFAKYYTNIMPILLNFLTAPTPEADDLQGKMLKGKVLECCGLIGLAVGPEIFRPDALQLAEALKQIQAGVTDDDDPLQTYVIMTWGKICEALKEDFAPYLPVVMPSLLKSAALSPELSVVNEEDNQEEMGDNWDVVDIGGQSIGIKTSSIEQTAEAFELLVIYASRMGVHFVPYMEETMGLSLKNLTFFFEESVRENAATIIPILMSTAKIGNAITPQLLQTVFEKLTTCLSTESDAPMLAIFFKSFADCVRVAGVENVSSEAKASFEKAAESQLTDLSDRRKLRAERSAEWDEEEKEAAYSLEREETQAIDQLTKTLSVFDSAHRLLFMASACKDLGFAPSEDWEDDEDA
ncbi:Karyopherin (importin) beta 3 [Phaffia rhodozyma]|uniref:Karyopherin (Importin) beta 3 n=1 Tax=Phaffia rhodozyma TaxID=264483 RepID=A0A0F7SZ58_PHARH|nr:Karyopherin (importin) beta 3 [Phaffia rhodozyma]